VDEKRGWYLMSKFKTIFFTSLITVIVLAAAVSISYMYGNRPGLSGSNRLQAGNSTVILKELNEISDLTVYRYDYTNVIISKTKGQVMGYDLPLSESVKLIKYQGYIKSGTDFSRLQININDKTKSVRVVAAKSVIQENAIRTEKTTVEDIKGEILSDYPSQLIIEEINQDKKAVEERIIKDGFLAESDRRLAALLETVIKKNGYDTVEIEFI
jgi:hypothetical protein